MSMAGLAEGDVARIAEAVRSAEARTSGEIVPVLVERSDTYEEAVWRAAAAFVVAALTVAFTLHALPGVLLPVTASRTVLAAFCAGAVGAAFAVLSPTFRRLAAGRTLMLMRVGARAERAFLREEVWKTRDRTGILVFVSLFEHQVVVLADAGIHARVAPGTWDGVVATVVAGMKAGRPGEALAAAVTQCGEILVKSGFTVRPDDTNELPDAPRFERDGP
jgi:putative membrane protein